MVSGQKARIKSKQIIRLKTCHHLYDFSIVNDVVAGCSQFHSNGIWNFQWNTKRSRAESRAKHSLMCWINHFDGKICTMYMYWTIQHVRLIWTPPTHNQFELAYVPWMCGKMSSRNRFRSIALKFMRCGGEIMKNSSITPCQWKIRRIHGESASREELTADDKSCATRFFCSDLHIRKSHRCNSWKLFEACNWIVTRFSNEWNRLLLCFAPLYWRHTLIDKCA